MAELLDWRIKHGHCKNKRNTRTYRAWTSAISRCENPKVRNYPRYGGRGLCVCRGYHSFEAFLRDLGEAPDGKTLDRIDNDLHYSCGHCEECLANGWPLNVRWATRSEQARNRSTNVFLTFRGRTKLLFEWAEELGISYNTLHARYRRGGSPEDILSRPLMPNGGWHPNSLRIHDDPDISRISG